MSKLEEFIKQARKHYSDRLAEEKERHQVLAIAEADVEHGSWAVVSDDYAGQLWRDLSQQLGLDLHVNCAPGDPQTVYVIVRKPVPDSSQGDDDFDPDELWVLWGLVRELEAEADVSNAEDKVWALALYEGPYRIEVPSGIMIV